jgi:hypothetical protein
MGTTMSDTVLYYEFEFKVGTSPVYAGLFHYAAVYRVTPGERLFIDRTRHHYRWTAKWGAKATARRDLAWIKARAKDEEMVWRP